MDSSDSELRELRGDAAAARSRTPGLTAPLALIPGPEVAPGDWVDLSGTYNHKDPAYCHDAAAIARTLDQHPGRLWPVVEVNGLIAVIQLENSQIFRLRKKLKRVWRADLSGKSNLVRNSYPNYSENETRSSWARWPSANGPKPPALT